MRRHTLKRPENVKIQGLNISILSIFYAFLAFLTHFVRDSQYRVKSALEEYYKTSSILEKIYPTPFGYSNITRACRLWSSSGCTWRIFATASKIKSQISWTIYSSDLVELICRVAASSPILVDIGGCLSSIWGRDYLQTWRSLSLPTSWGSSVSSQIC